MFTPISIIKLIDKYLTDATTKAFIDVVAAYAESSVSSSPNPIAVMDIEGNLNSSDAVIVNTDMDIAISCGIRYQFTGESAHIEQATRYLMAWAAVYIPMGNPITEEVFFKYVAAYDIAKGSISRSKKLVIDAFLRRLFYAGTAFIALRDPVLSHSNFESRGLMLLTAIAYALDDREMKAYCLTLYDSQIRLNILAAGTIGTSIPYVIGAVPTGVLSTVVEAGTTFDFYHRDAVLYHVASVNGLLFAALVAQNNGENWFARTSASGKKLNDGVVFAYPFATGARTHIDFANSFVSFDSTRVGTFNPLEAKNSINIAALVSSQYAGIFSITTMPTWEQILYYSTV